MSNEKQSPAPGSPSSGDFAREAQERDPGLLWEFWDFLRFNKKWWLTPIVLVLLLLGTLVMLSSTAVAPFIYAIF